MSEVKLNQTDSEKLVAPSLEECVACGLRTVHVHIVHQRFQYGEPGKEVTLVAPVPVSTCKSCGSEYTGEEAEEARHDAICRHLGCSPREK